MLLVNQMCSIIQPSEASLVIGCSKFLINLIKQGIILQGRTYTASKRWILENLEFSDSVAMIDTLSVLEMILITGPFNNFMQVKIELKKIYKIFSSFCL